MLVAALTLVLLALETLAFRMFWRTARTGSHEPSLDQLLATMQAYYVSAAIGLAGAVLGLLGAALTWNHWPLLAAVVAIGPVLGASYNLAWERAHPVYLSHVLEQDHHGLPVRKWWQWPSR